MLNQGGIIKETLVTPNQILFNVEHQVSVGVRVDDSAGTLVDGKKVVKAGTLLAGDITTRGTAFTKAATTTDTSNAVGVLLHDIDVTKGDANATMLIHGFVNLDRVDSAVAALVDGPAKTALKGQVWFLKD